MKRCDFEKQITEKYGVEPEYPWAKMPTFAVYRHSNNQKWFAVVMTITKDKLGLDSTENIDIVNLKCDPLFMGSVLNEAGVFPAYHMSKAHWISVALDGSVEKEKAEWLLDLSYDLTNRKMKKMKKPPESK